MSWLNQPLQPIDFRTLLNCYMISRTKSVKQNLRHSINAIPITTKGYYLWQKKKN